MISKIRAPIALMAALCAIGFALPGYCAPAAEAFGSLPRAEYGRLSPDGNRLAIIRPYGGREKVAFYDLTAPGTEPYIIGVEDAIAGEVFWKGNDRAVCVFHANFKRRWAKNFFAASRAIVVNPGKRT